MNSAPEELVFRVTLAEISAMQSHSISNSASARGVRVAQGSE